jgi:hypothetical protein
MYFSPHSLGEAFKKSGTTTENNVLEKVLAHVHVALHN